MTDYHIRQSTPTDASLIAYHRRLMFADQDNHSEAELQEMETEYTEWVTAKLKSGEYIGWFATDEDEEVIAGVGLWLREWPPILNDETGRQGYVENVYTTPAHRRRGLSRQLMNALLDWAGTTGRVKLIELHASPVAQPLYESLGFSSEDGLMLLWVG